jgi:NAD(P)-dependent dehydrogenase (short-subunit alcohol dehydrogenase family)
MSGPVTFVAGGSGGLGSAICERLARDGRRLFLTYRSSAAQALALVDRLRAEGAEAACGQADLGSLDAVERAFEAAAAFGRIDAIVYAAGPPIPQRWFSLVSPEDWQRHVLGELGGFFNLVHLALPLLRAGGGALAATTSVAPRRAIAGDVLSAVPKAGIEMLVRQIAREEGRYGIRANCVSPGIIDAGLGLRAQRDHYTPEIWDAQRRSVPLRRFGTARAVAGAVSYLLSDEADYVTGQTIIVDGGMTA